MYRKKTSYDLRFHYPILVETGIIFTLLILIGLAHVRLPVDSPQPIQYAQADETAIVLPPIVSNVPKFVPPPPVPQIPVEVPDDKIIEPDELDFDDFEKVTEIDPPKLDREIEIPIDYAKLEKIDILPVMIGGEQAFRKSIEYPYQARRFGIEGIVEVEFTVTSKGRVINPVITRGIGGGCDEAVLKAIQLQRYTPGVINGEHSEFRIKEIVQFILLSRTS